MRWYTVTFNFFRLLAPFHIRKALQIHNFLSLGLKSMNNPSKTTVTGVFDTYYDVSILFTFVGVFQNKNGHN